MLKTNANARFLRILQHFVKMQACELLLKNSFLHVLSKYHTENDEEVQNNGGDCCQTFCS